MLHYILAWLYNYALGIALKHIAWLFVKLFDRRRCLFLYTSCLWIQFRTISFPSLLAGTYNCAGCYFTWAWSYGLVIMLQLQQNSNEVHPQESWMCLHWDIGSGSSTTPSTQSDIDDLSVKSKPFCSKLILKFVLKTKQLSHIAFVVAPMWLHRLVLFIQKYIYIWVEVPYFCLVPTEIATWVADKWQHSIQYYMHHIFTKGALYTKSQGSAHFCALCCTVLRPTPKLMDVLNTYFGRMVKSVF